MTIEIGGRAGWHPQFRWRNTTLLADVGYGIVTFAYEPLGRVKTKQDQTGTVVTYNHDATGRLLNRQHVGNSSVDTDSFTYDHASKGNRKGNREGNRGEGNRGHRLFKGNRGHRLFTGGIVLQVEGRFNRNTVQSFHKSRLLSA